MHAHILDTVTGSSNVQVENQVFSRCWKTTGAPKIREWHVGNPSTKYVQRCKGFVAQCGASCSSAPVFRRTSKQELPLRKRHWNLHPGSNNLRDYTGALSLGKINAWFQYLVKCKGSGMGIRKSGASWWFLGSLTSAIVLRCVTSSWTHYYRVPRFTMIVTWCDEATAGSNELLEIPEYVPRLFQW